MSSQQRWKPYARPISGSWCNGAQRTFNPQGVGSNPAGPTHTVASSSVVRAGPL